MAGKGDRTRARPPAGTDSIDRYDRAARAVGAAFAALAA